MPECTKCGCELEFDDTVDQYSDANVVEFKEYGHCPNCGKNINGEMFIYLTTLKI